MKIKCTLKLLSGYYFTISRAGSAVIDKHS